MPDKRNDGDVGGASADIHHHVAGGFGNGKTRADGRHHGLFHQVHFAGLGAISRIDDRAFFHLGDFARHADYNSRMHQNFAAVRLLNEIIQHALGDFEIGDDAVFHGTDRHDISRRAAEHLLGFFAHRLHFAVGLVDGHDGRLVHNDAFAFCVNQRIGGPKVDRQIRREQAKQRTNVHVETLPVPSTRANRPCHTHSSSGAEVIAGGAPTIHQKRIIFNVLHQLFQRTL